MLTTIVSAVVALLRTSDDESKPRARIDDLRAVPADRVAGPFGDPLSVSGTVSNRSADRPLWVLIATDRFYPQQRVPLATDGPWKADAFMGDPGPRPAYTFSVLVVEVDTEGDDTIDAYIRKAKETHIYSGMSALPSGSGEVAALQLTLPRLHQ